MERLAYYLWGKVLDQTTQVDYQKEIIQLPLRAISATVPEVGKPSSQQLRKPAK